MMKLSRAIVNGSHLLRHFGLGWLAYRAGYALRARSGELRRRTPLSTWSGQPLEAFLIGAIPDYLAYRRESAPRFFFAPADRSRYNSFFAQWDHGEVTPVGIANDIASGRFRYFEHTVRETGFPPNWHTNPFTGQQAPAARHWSQIADFKFGDIKAIWEPSRFGFAYALVRAYWRTGDDRYAEIFWSLVEDWREHNWPNQGPNWKCGQEASLRVMAWCFGLYGFLDSVATTSEHVAHLAQMIAFSGSRIAANFDYALSQKNNHGISEAVGLWTIGVLFPEFRQAARWVDLGRAALEAQARELIYDDGAFSQHSVNYHRLMLHDYVWAARLGDLAGQPFSRDLHQRLDRAGDLLFQMQDAQSGRLSCYGSNDGALVLPLNNCDYRDYRPAIQAVSYLTSATRRYAAGPWDEDLLWLYGPDALAAPLQGATRNDLAAKFGGYYTLRTAVGFAFVRCGSFRHRPSQADLLHVDVWWRGQNVALDPGTYSYNAPAPWDNALAGTAYHNTVIVDGLDQMARVGRFLWLPWARGQVHDQVSASRAALSYWEGQHDGYGRLRAPVLHRRGILRLGPEHWLVWDGLRSAGEHRYLLHWLLPDLPCDWDEAEGRLVLHTAAGDYGVQAGATAESDGASLVRADASSPHGWQAPYYGAREPALSFSLAAHGADLDFWTVLGPLPFRATYSEGWLELSTPSWIARVCRASAQGAALLAAAHLSGAITDSLELT